MSPDPYGQYYSPYMAMGNNPVMGVEPLLALTYKKAAGAHMLSVTFLLWACCPLLTSLIDIIKPNKPAGF